MKNKRKLYIVGLVAAVFSILLGGYVLFDKKIEAYAATTVYKGQPYYISFSAALTEASVTDGSIFVKDGNDKTVDAIFTLDKERKNVTIEGLAVGKYTIYVDKGAFATKTKFKKDRQFTVQVVDNITKLSKLEDLQAYFSTLVNLQYTYGKESGVTAESSSTQNSSEVAMDQSASDSSGRASGTNNQVDGIEEGDVIITDGSFIYSLVDDQLIITSAKDPARLSVVKKLKLGENAYPTHLLLHNKTLIVGYSTYMESVKGNHYDGKSVAKFAFYDVKDPENPTLLREIGQDGSLTSVRKSGNILYMISSQTPNYWMLREGVDVELRPFTYDSSADSTALPLDRIHLLPGSTEPNYLVVSAVDVSNIQQATVNTQSYLGNSGSMYMSQNAIYMTAMDYSMIPFMSNMETSSISVDSAMPAYSNETTVYKIAIDKTAIDMVAQTKVKGSVLNQFSMDEHNGYFRIATTEGEAWGTNAESKNHLFIFDKDLKQVGNVSDLARGERIYSARFMGDKAYIVTFKQVDPLFVIDVANPTAPKVLGELKIPGFSNYLHPIGENHLLGIGYDTEVTMQPGAKEPIVLMQGMKLSLFNVTNLANPIEQDSVVIGGRGTYSDVQHDHKALFRDVENHLYGFPITIYEPRDDYNLNYKGTGAQLYKVTVDGGIELAADLVQPPANGEQYEDWYQVVQRLLYIDDALYTVSRSQIKSYDLNTFKPISSVELK